jgi:phage-related minor tail protein
MPNYKVGIEIDADTKDSAKQIGNVAGAAGSLDDAFGGGMKNMGAFGVTLGDLLTPTGALTAGVGLLVGALAAGAGHAMALATEVESSTALMTTQLGLTDEAALGFENTMRSIYENNYGESFSDIAADMVAVEQQLGRIGGSESQAQLQEMTELAIAFGDAFDKDVGESTSAAVTLMENFELSATQAFDFLVAGQQRGLDSSGDLLESIGEYGVQFGQGGASAAEFFSILETGNAGGVLGTDKVADAFKEFSIRIMDDSTTTKTALAGIGISYDTLKQGFTDGSVTTVEAMQTVIAKINEIEDPIERNKAGVALFGTQWEDLTETVLTEVDLQKTSLEELEGAAASLEEQYNKTGAEGAGAMREWNNALVDVGTELNALKDAALPALTWVLSNVAIPVIQDLAEWLNSVATTIEQVRWGIDYFLFRMGKGDDPGAPPDVSGFSSAVPAAQPAMAGASAAGGSQIYQQFYIERGDFETVAAAANFGLGEAQRSRGS